MVIVWRTIYIYLYIYARIKNTFNPKHICQSTQEDSHAAIDCQEAQMEKKNKLQNNQETQKGERRSRCSQTQGTQAQCEAELKSSKVWQAKITLFSLAGKACKRKQYTLSV